MQVKKAGGKVYGAVLTAAEKKAMDLEIQRELAEYDRKHIAEIDATIYGCCMSNSGSGLSGSELITTPSTTVSKNWSAAMRWRTRMIFGSALRC